MGKKRSLRPVLLYSVTRGVVVVALFPLKYSICLIEYNERRPAGCTGGLWPDRQSDWLAGFK